MCPLECENLRYELTVSRNQFPTPNYAKKMMATRSPQLDILFDSLGKDNVSFETLKSTFASVFIKFDQLAVREVIEQPTIGFTDLISNLGGIMGLFLALSVLSLMELIEFAVFSLHAYYQVRILKSRPKI